MDLNKRGRTGVAALAGLAAAALLLAGCSGGGGGGGDAGGADSDYEPASSAEDISALGGDAAASELNDLYAAAKDAGEDTVTIYGPSDQALADAGMYDLFEKRFPGISVNIVTTFGAEMDQKVTNEAASGNGVGDVAHTGTTVIKWAANDLLTSFTPKGVADIPDSLSDKDGYFHGNQFGAIGFLVNTSKIDIEDAPHDWSKLDDPKYRGMLAMTNPSGPGSLSDILSTLVYDGDLDADSLKAIHDNDLLVVGSTDLAVQAVITGQRPVGIGIGMTAYLKAKDAGAPVAMVYPMDGPTPVVVTNVAVLKSAPNPNAAKLLDAWLFTPEAASALPAGGLYGVLPDSPAPEGFEPLSDADVVLPPPSEKVTENSKKTLGILADLFGN